MRDIIKDSQVHGRKGALAELVALAVWVCADADGIAINAPMKRLVGGLPLQIGPARQSCCIQSGGPKYERDIPSQFIIAGYSV